MSHYDRCGFAARDGRRIYWECFGTCGPVVLFEVGLGYKPGTQHEGFHRLRAALAPHGRVLLYDRAGMGRSDLAPEPLTIDDYVDDLRAVLRGAALPPPYLLVGGSIGSLIVLRFGARYGAEVGGIVLVDGAHPDQWRRMRRLLPLPSPDEPPSLTRFRDVDLAEGLVVGQNEERMNLPGSVRQFAGITLGALPLTVLTAGVAEWEPGFPPDAALAIEREWLQMQRELAALSQRSSHRIIGDSGHCMHDDRPDVVIDAVLEQMQALATGRPEATAL